MYIKPSTDIRNNYNEISRLCKETGEPVYLTKNGEGDLVVMDINYFERRKKALEVEAALLQARQERLDGAPSYTVKETMDMMERVITEVGNRDRK